MPTLMRGRTRAATIAALGLLTLGLPRKAFAQG